MNIDVPIEDSKLAWTAICRALRRHVMIHGDPPSKIFVGPAGLAAIHFDVMDGMLDMVQVIPVLEFPPTTTMTVA